MNKVIEVEVVKPVVVESPTMECEIWGVYISRDGKWQFEMRCWSYRNACACARTHSTSRITHTLIPEIKEES